MHMNNKYKQLLKHINEKNLVVLASENTFYQYFNSINLILGIDKSSAIFLIIDTKDVVRRFRLITNLLRIFVTSYIIRKQLIVSALFVLTRKREYKSNHYYEFNECFSFCVHNLILLLLFNSIFTPPTSNAPPTNSAPFSY